MKVYVLTTSYSMDYECGIEVNVYSTPTEAKKIMKKDYEEMCEEWDNVMSEREIDEMSASMQEPGDYTRNHIDWLIHEKVVYAGEPYAYVCYYFNEDKSATENGIIKIGGDNPDKNDDKIFFYVKDEAELKSLFEKGKEDFTLLDVYFYTNDINQI